MGIIQNLFLILVSIVLFISTALSVPRLTLTGGVKCGACHYNLTGGQLRNEYGIKYSINKLPLEKTCEDVSFDPKISENITVGGEYRYQALYNQMGKKSSTAFHAMSTALYGLMKLTRQINFYLKYDLINYNNYEVYAIAQILPENFYVRVGSFLPEYGWKMDDHTIYTRGGEGSHTSGLIFQSRYKDIGFEIGGSIDGFTINASLLNGFRSINQYSPNRDFAYVGKLSYLGSIEKIFFHLGASGYGFRDYKIVGFNYGIGMEDFAFYGEINRTRRRLNVYTYYIDPTSSSFAGFIELDYRVMQGIWITTRFEIFNPKLGIKNDDLQRIVIGVEFFPYSFVEIRPQYRLNLESPARKNDQAIVQIHLWY